MTRSAAGRWLITCALVVAAVGCSEGADVGDAPASATESSAVSGEAVTTTARDFQIRYRLEGATADSGAVGLVSSSALTLDPSVESGAQVVDGQAVGELEVAADVASALEAAGATSTIDASRLAQLEGLTGPAEAPVSGIFDAGDGVPVIRSAGIDVVVPLTPVQDLRFRSMMFAGTASVETIAGTRDVSCDALWLERSEVASDDEGPTTGEAELHCRLPHQVETAAGLRAMLAIESEVLTDVVVLPNIYIGYDAAADGYFIRINEEGVERSLAVSVGVTDGAVRVLTSEVPIGVEVLLPEGSESGD